MTSHFSLRAHWVVPVDGNPIEGGTVTIADGQIVALGTQPEGPIEDLGEVTLLPGLVNSHTHLEFSELEQPLGQPGMTLPAWIQQVIASRGTKHRDPQRAIAAGLQESSRLGVTTIGDIATEITANIAADQPQVIGFQEVIGFSSARHDSVLTDVKHRLAASGLDSGISPHAPYTVHPILLEHLIDLACKHKIPVAMHLAESPEELQLLTDGTGAFQKLLEERSMWDNEAIPAGSRPLDYLKSLARAPRAIVVHGNYLDLEEIEFLASQRERMSIAYCPRTHAYFGHSPYPLSQMLTAGVRVALGTDSRASNPDLNLLSEMRHIAQHHPQVSPEQILRMGTLSGAEALGLANTTGSITAGKWANLTAVPRTSSTDDPWETILHSNELPISTFIRGKLVR